MGILTCYPLIYIMNYLKFIVSHQMEERICRKKVFKHIRKCLELKFGNIKFMSNLNVMSNWPITHDPLNLWTWYSNYSWSLNYSWTWYSNYSWPLNYSWTWYSNYSWPLNYSWTWYSHVRKSLANYNLFCTCIFIYMGGKGWHLCISSSNKWLSLAWFICLWVTEICFKINKKGSNM